MDVPLLERESRGGRRLLATGNGRCNLTNCHVSPDRYHGEDAEFCAYALRAFDTGETLQYFAGLGLLTVSEESGRVYPASNMAGSVLDVLRYALERPGIRVCTGQTATAVKRTAAGFTVRTETDVFHGEKLILAAGGCAGSKVGGVMDGYRLGRALGHHRTALYPSLVQIRTDPTYPRALKGVKAQCGINLRRGGQTVAENRGEVLFTEYGVSGPAVFDISRAAATGGEVLVKNVIPKHLECISAKLRETGTIVQEYEDCVLVKGNGHLRKANIKTLPYPGFPTDMQPQMGALLCMANGTSVITEGIYDNRFKYVNELRKMGADIQVDGRIAIFEGGAKLTGAPVMACDLRAGAAMVIAGLCASGKTEIEDIHFIERGYENFVGKLRKLGADISIVDYPDEPELHDKVISIG